MSKYSYEFSRDDKYCYKGTNILRNKLNIKDNEKLNQVEREIGYINYVEILKNPILGDFSLKHLQAIHYKLFSDIYSWAGETREVDISKGVQFCRCDFIENQFKTIEELLKKDNYLLDIKSKNEAVEKYAFYLSEINAIHPFREGNGRAQRVYMNYLSRLSGYKLDFSMTTKEEMIESCHEAFLCDYSKMENLIKNCITDMSEKERKQYIKLFGQHIRE